MCREMEGLQDSSRRQCVGRLRRRQCQQVVSAWNSARAGSCAGKTFRQDSGNRVESKAADISSGVRMRTIVFKLGSCVRVCVWRV